MAERKAVIKNADMSEDMQQDAVECATQALEKFNIEKDIAAYIKKEFDKKYNPTWHCVVGRNFGSYVTHETKHFIYFYLGQVAILLFKSGWSGDCVLLTFEHNRKVTALRSDTRSTLLHTFSPIFLSAFTSIALSRSRSACLSSRSFYHTLIFLLLVFATLC